MMLDLADLTGCRIFIMVWSYPKFLKLHYHFEFVKETDLTMQLTELQRVNELTKHTLYVHPGGFLQSRPTLNRCGQKLVNRKALRIAGL
jgi:hypothetical protein